jgi:hypothetical protein
MPRMLIPLLIMAVLSVCSVALPAAGGTNVFINGRELTPKQIVAITITYRYAPIPGRTRICVALQASFLME